MREAWPERLLDGVAAALRGGGDDRAEPNDAVWQCLLPYFDRTLLSIEECGRLWSAGRAAAPVLAGPERWILRCDEEVTFYDAIHVHRVLKLSTRTPERSATYLPLAAVSKDLEAINIDLRDEEDRSLPRPTRAENTLLTSAAVTAALEGALQHELRQEELMDVVATVQGRGRKVRDAAVELVHIAGVRRFTTLIPLIRMTGGHWVLWVRMAAQSERDRVLALSYDHALPSPELAPLHRAGTALGWRGYQQHLPLQASDARSYHVRFVAPPDVEIRDVVVRAVDLGAERGAGYSEEQVVHDRVADVRIEGAAGAPPLFVKIAMRAGRHHVLPMAFVAATLIAAMLTAAYVAAESLARQNQATTAVSSAIVVTLPPGL